MDYKQGAIYLVDFNPAKGGEIGKLRPAVVVSSELDNSYLATVVVLPLSTHIEPKSFPYRMFLPKREKLRSDSDLCIYEIRALSKGRLKEYLASLSKEELQIVQDGLCRLFGGLT